MIMLNIQGNHGRACNLLKTSNIYNFIEKKKPHRDTGLLNSPT